MSETAMLMAVQAVALALIGRIRWRCHEDGSCTSGCTEHSLIPNSDSIDVGEFIVGEQKVLIVTSK